ncbi:glycosyltransferase [Thermoproteota archaeon]
MLSLSVCIIAKGEEPFIETTLRSVKECADEIILIDTGLSKKTRAKLDSFMQNNPDFAINQFTYPWEDDFSQARNFSLSKATKDWILVIDADEFIESKDIMRLLKVAEEKKEVKGFSLIQRTYTNNVDVFGFIKSGARIKQQGHLFTFEGHTACNAVRLFKQDKNIMYENPVHESADQSIRKLGKLGKTNIVIHHLKELKGMDWTDQTQLHYMDIYKKNLDRFTNKAKAYSDLGILYYSYNKDYPKAAEFLQKAVKEYEARSQKPREKTLFTLAYAYYMSDDFDNAKSVFEQFIDVYPGHESSDRARNALQMIAEKQNL